MTRFDDYRTAAATGTVQLSWRYELINPAGELLATFAMVDDVNRFGMSVEPVSVSLQRISERTLRFRLIPKDATQRPMSPGSQVTHDSLNRVRIYAVLHFGGSTIEWLKGTVMFGDMEQIQIAGVVTVEGQLVDTLRPIRSNMCSGYSWPAGSPIETVVGQVLSQCGISADLAVTGYTLPAGSLGAEADRELAVRTMLEGAGHELTSDASGNVFSRPIMPSDDDADAERWAYGGDGIPVSQAKRKLTTRNPAGCKVHAGGVLSSSRSQDLIIFDTDPRSEGLYQGPGETSLISLRAPWVEGSRQAAEAGYAQLRRLGTGAGIVEMTCSPNPAMELGDLVDLDDGDLSGAYRVIGYKLPLELNGEMTATLRGVFDPATGYTFPIDIGEGCATATSDNFDRPDEDLEDNSGGFGEPGSAEWTEINYSWAVVGQRAVQRFTGWSLAYDNTPMCSQDHETTIEIGDIPSGRRLGPVARANGSFEGYAALVNSSGRIQLEAWQGTQSIGVLGSHQISGSVSGTSVTVRAVGSEISVLVSNTEVITATDTRLTGSHVGMLAYGGDGAQAPSVETFSGEVAA